jgi:hypothetical protein
MKLVKLGAVLVDYIIVMGASCVAKSENTTQNPWSLNIQTQHHTPLAVDLCNN